MFTRFTALLAATLLAIAVGTPAHAIHSMQGKDLNGKDLNGTELNGTELNGKDVNGKDVNGQQLSGTRQALDGRVLMIELPSE
ncbi:MAG: hypothetical protein JO055_12735 [Alphaproteobacteria bacterium]|nr:hypothetical protein [Alphaproteobacteria bacterium]